MKRLAYVDNLRVVLTVLVVLHHVALTYGNIPVWYHVEPAQDPSGLALDVLVMFDQAFFMGLFFLLSGFFTPGSHDRKGARPFLRDRLVRLGIPLLVFLLLLRPLVTFGIYRETDLPYWQFYLASWDPGPMWFVEVLLVLVAGYALVRRYGRAPRPVPQGAPGLAAIAGYTLALAASTFLWRLVVPTGLYVPVLGLPTPSHLPQYVSMFVLGTLAFRHGWFDALSRRAGRLGFAVAAACSLVLLPVRFATQGVPSELAAATWEAVFAVGITIGLLVTFRERLNRQGPRGRFLSDQAYTVYFIHPVVLVGLSYAFSALHAAAIVKFAVVAVLALPLCWGLAYLVRSLPGAKRVL
ncbi:acyltransferase family protein [Nonomuraea dietziae]|uniref:Peptidoglycan/LPS O-acetylase OafA/YrhL n=4 Tax=Nonomuraea dietziae TaxID=65515 RepID=A0A7W5YSL1_9ACTN|nr:acyltransferase family protein [Nonomuraea dietziae]MBB3732532.1 peptidoglycan/LPS O-acetylase OafA/YrhL [Nonomuraea dietziae]